MFIVVSYWDNAYGPFNSEDEAISWAKSKPTLSRWEVKKLREAQ